MQYIKYLEAFECGNALPKLNDEQTMRLFKVLQLEARLDEGFVARGVSRFEERTPRQKELQQELWDITGYLPAHRLLKDMVDKSNS